MSLLRACVSHERHVWLVGNHNISLEKVFSLGSLVPQVICAATNVPSFT